MRIDILTLFPDMFSALKESILGRAQREGKIEINVVDIRKFTEDKHLKCDDYPFGGGAGMVMMPQPIGSAIEVLDKEHRAHRIYLSPKGETLRQQKVFSLLSHDWLILLCGHYEGVDQRAIDLFIDEEISIGDYVLTAGNCPPWSWWIAFRDMWTESSILPLSSTKVFRTIFSNIRNILGRRNIAVFPFPKCF